MSDWEGRVERAAAVAIESLASLPAELRELAEQVPLTFEKRPTRAMRAEGITPDTLGLFVGESIEDAGESLAPMPGQIILFLDNIWDFADGDTETFEEEVRITLLHELGHYLGWDEEDLFDRDLD